MAEYKFGDNKKTLRRAEAIAGVLIAEADQIASADQGVDVDRQHAVEFPTLFGWWRHINRTATALRTLVDAGHTIETTPLVRAILEHTYSMIWLADVGAAGIAVVEDSTWENRKKLIENLERANWKLPDGVSVGSRPSTIPAPGTPAADWHSKIKGEFDSFDQMDTAFGNADMYPVYRNLCDYTHASAWTAFGYLEPLKDGSVALRFAADHKGRANTIWTTVCLIQAGLIISPMISGDPLDKTLQSAIRDLGIPNDLLPQRRPKAERKRPSMS